MKPVKIAFIGTHGTTKTTLAYSITGELKKRGYNVSMITEVARDCPLPINEKSSIDSELWIMCNQISRELEETKKYSVIICDRSTLDTYCYALNSYGGHKILEDLLNYSLPTYDLLLRLPINKRYKLVKDKFRSTSKRFQKKIDKILDKELKERNIDHVKLPKVKTAQTALDEVLKYLRNRHKFKYRK